MKQGDTGLINLLRPLERLAVDYVKAWELVGEIRKGLHDDSVPHPEVVKAWVSRLGQGAQEDILRQALVGLLLGHKIPPEDLKNKIDFWIEKSLDPSSMLR